MAKAKRKRRQPLGNVINERMYQRVAAAIKAVTSTNVRTTLNGVMIIDALYSSAEAAENVLFFKPGLQAFDREAVAMVKALL